MYKCLLKAILCLLFISATTGCYINITQPLDVDLDKTDLGSKVGRASIQSVLWSVAWGDSGTKAAAENGGIKTIRHADTQLYSILFGLYAKETTIVYGD